MGKNDRFVKVYSQGSLSPTEIWVDKETGVHYLFHVNGYAGHVNGYAGGLTPLLDKNGEPVVGPVQNK